MATTTPAPEVPDGLVEHVLDGPAVRPHAIEAGRRRAAGGPLDADRIADAVVAEGPPLLQQS
jgi:hypothetical protein